jgi:hypothetical protein
MAWAAWGAREFRGILILAPLLGVVAALLTSVPIGLFAGSAGLVAGVGYIALRVSKQARKSREEHLQHTHSYRIDAEAIEFSDDQGNSSRMSLGFVKKLQRTRVGYRLHLQNGGAMVFAFRDFASPTDIEVFEGLMRRRGMP